MQHCSIRRTFTYNYSGTINGKYEIIMTIIKNENKITGSYYYKSQNKPIQLAGSINGKNITINELDNTGKTTGTFTGTTDDFYSINGTWHSADGKKNLIFDLAKFGSSETNKVYKNIFTVKDPSPKYSIKFSVEKREADHCEGGSAIEVIEKSTNRVFQKLYSDDLYFFLDKKNASLNAEELNGDDIPVIFDDFNFDGEEDLAIRNGNASGYGGPSYDIYLFDKQVKKFVLNVELTVLATTNLGLFEIDKKRKRLIASSKSGCCWHQAVEYEWINNALVDVREVTEDATESSGNQDEDMVTVTEKVLINGKWQSTEKKYKIKDYYK